MKNHKKNYLAEKGNTPRIREGLETDIPAISDFLQRNIIIHRHLDWRSPAEWAGHQPFLILERRGQIQGLLACPPDPKGIYWIRILASRFTVPIEECYQALFPAALKNILAMDNVPTITSIAYLDWMQSLLAHNGWEICQHVVQLNWNKRKAAHTLESCPEDITIRAMELKDIPDVAFIDKTCFNFLWQHSEDALRRAYEKHTFSTVAEKNGKLVGYQITTLQQTRAHIARLAVLPEFQGLHIGQHLISDVISQHHKPWIREISVNTQQDNKKSLGLYQKIGFDMTNESFPIFIYKG